MKPTVALIGTGKLARALTPALQDAGYRLVRVTARTAAAARRFRRDFPRCAPVTGTDLPEGAGLVLLAVPDRDIAGVSERLAAGPAPAGEAVLHHAGGLGVEPLAPLGEAGVPVGVLHPLQVLGTAGSGLLRGSYARIEGEPRARRFAAELAADLGMKPLRFRRKPTSEDRSAYHAGAALASNDLVALVSLGVDLLVASGIGRKQALDALASLAEGAVANLRDGGIRGAITGPVSRGDTATVAAHLDRLNRVAPGFREVHRLLSRRILDLAGSPDPAMDRLLDRRGKR